MFTNLGVITKGTVIEVNISELEKAGLGIQSMSLAMPIIKSDEEITIPNKNSHHCYDGYFYIWFKSAF